MSYFVMSLMGDYHEPLVLRRKWATHAMGRSPNMPNFAQGGALLP